MADENTGAASAATSREAQGFIGGFAPAHIAEAIEQVQKAQEGAPKEEAPKEGTGEPKAEAPKQEPKTSLAETIRAMREARQAKEQEAARAKDWESKYNELNSKMEQLQRSSDFESDPVAYARARGWDKEKQALMGQMLLYDLVPDKAPPDLRIRLMEAKQAEKERKAEEQAKQREQEQAQAAQRETFNAFVGAVEQAVQSFAPGSYPESEAWFVNPDTGEHDPDTYMRSLVATAVNMAAKAQRDGKVADLSPVSIAKTLEAEIARRMAVRDGRRQKAAAPVSKPVEQQSGAKGEQPRSAGGVQPTESTKGTYGSGTPRPKATSDEERVQRAIEAAFKTPGSH